MTRHGKRGADGEQGGEQWRADYGRPPARRADARSEYRAAAWDNVSGRGPQRGGGAVGTSSDPGSMRWDESGQRWDQTAPPWELPGWDDEPGTGGGRRPRADDLTGGHPSAPLPRVTGPLSPPEPDPLTAPSWPGSLPPASSGPLPRVSSSGPQPRVSSSGPLPRVSSSGPLPRVSSSGPLPRVSSSGPMPAVGDHPGRGVPGPQNRHSAYPGDGDYDYDRGHGGYPGGEYSGGDEPRYRRRHSQGGYQEGYPGDDYSGTGYAPGGYQGGSYPDAAGPHGGAGYPGEDGYPPDDPYATESTYPGRSALRHSPPPDADYPGGGEAYPGTEEYPGSEGYLAEHEYPTDAAYGEPGGYGGYPAGPGYPADENYPEYPEDSGYPGSFAPGDEPYPEYGAPASRHGTGERGYTDHGDWYGDVDDEQAWADEEYDDGFVPGLGGDDEDAGPRRGSRPAAVRVPTPRGGSPRGRGGKSGKGGKSAVRRLAPWVAVGVLLLVLCGAGGGYYYVYRTYLHPPDWAGAGHGTVDITIQQGDTAAAVGQVLAAKGVVASARAFSNAAKNSSQGRSLEPGTFRLHLHMSAALAFQLLLNPASRVQTKVTLPEGLRLSNIIAILGKNTGDLQGYQQAIKQTSQLGLPPYAKGNPQGYLFPDTYSIQHGTSPLQVLKNMVTAFDKEATRVNLVKEAAAGNISPADVVTVASLVEAEGGRTQDFPKIAEVIYNRLNQGMKLQLDSTVLFALNKYGILATNAQLNVKSPYNTYQHMGLPPGPIDSPGNAAIQAALHPAHGKLLYFVTVDPKNRITKFTSSPSVFLQLKHELMHNLAKSG